VLLSGSTDGLINIFNTDITDEDEALYQVINHGSSIHHGGFLNDTDIFALSHDEKFSVYKIANPDESVEEPAPVVFGDIRPKLGCEYAVGLTKTKADGTILAVGNHR
jgi:SEL1 protein